MKKLLCFLFGAVLAAPVLAADPNFSGRWTLSSAPAAGGAPAAAPQGGGGGGGRGGAGGGPTFTFTHAGNRISGTGTGGRGNAGVDLIDLKVEGNKISFYTWSGGDEPFKTTYVGTMNPDETISFTVTAHNRQPLVPAIPGASQGRGRGGPAAPAAAPAPVAGTTAPAAAPAPVPQQMIARRTVAP